MYRIALLLALAFSPLWLTGCNTIKGLGQDTEAAGEAIEDTARENKPY